MSDRAGIPPCFLFLDEGFQHGFHFGFPDDLREADGEALQFGKRTGGLPGFFLQKRELLEGILAPLLAGDKLLQNALVIAVLASLVLYTLLTRRSFVFDAAIEGIAPDVAAPQVEVQYVDSLASRCEQAVTRYALTAREADVMTLLAHGNTATRIQAELGISYNTVKYHVKNVYAKLDVHSQQELIDLLCEKKAE